MFACEFHFKFTLSCHCDLKQSVLMKESCLCVICQIVNVNDRKEGRSVFFQQMKLALFYLFEVTTQWREQEGRLSLLISHHLPDQCSNQNQCQFRVHYLKWSSLWSYIVIITAPQQAENKLSFSEGLKNGLYKLLNWLFSLSSIIFVSVWTIG